MVKRARWSVKKIVLLSVLIVGLGLGLTIKDTHAQIKELRIGIGIDADTLNPQEQTTSLIQNICDLIFDNFLYQTPEGKLEPRLVTKYDISKDGLTWTLHLRKGVKFSDGTDFNADAVKLSWDRILDPQKRVPLRFSVSVVKECIKVDDHTVQLKLQYPFAPMAPGLSMTICSVISPAAIKKHGEDVRQHPVGAGPYKLQEWVKGDRIVLVRNENYYGQKPTVDKLTLLIVPEVSTREAMLRAGQVDICYKPSPSNVAGLKADPKITVEMPLSTRSMFMAFRTDLPLFKNKEVRQGFNYAIDKKAKELLKKIGRAHV